jgi:lipoprotein NlpD
MTKWSEASRAARAIAALAAVAVVSACTTRAVKEAPIVDRSSQPVTAAVPSATDAPAGAGPPVLRTAPESRGDSYVVQRGDTLYSIALAFGQDYRDIARWNGVTDPARLTIGQSLRVAPPPAEEGAGAGVSVTPVTSAPAAQARPLDASEPAASAGTVPKAAPAGPAVAAGSVAPQSPVAPEPANGWIWPAGGSVIATFEDPRNKGIDIAGSAGDPVVAANDGNVVYVGSGLRGYGNLLIIKHSDDFLSAYAHNRQILVKEGQSVKRGQRVAELGQSDADRPKLHFEIRRRGQPVDPLKYLPAR